MIESGGDEDDGRGAMQAAAESDSDAPRAITDCDHHASGYFRANPVTTKVGKLRITPQWAMRKLRFIRVTFAPLT